MKMKVLSSFWFRLIGRRDVTQPESWTPRLENKFSRMNESDIEEVARKCQMAFDALTEIDAFPYELWVFTDEVQPPEVMRVRKGEKALRDVGLSRTTVKKLISRANNGTTQSNNYRNN